MKPTRMNTALGVMFGMLLPAGVFGDPSQLRERAVRVRSTTVAGRGPGWSRAQVKRNAKKRRNVLRNRRAHRGQRS